MSLITADLPVKPFCPCDTGNPQECKPEQWPGAHAHRDCRKCGKPEYQHLGLGTTNIRCP